MWLKYKLSKDKDCIFKHIFCYLKNELSSSTMNFVVSVILVWLFIELKESCEKDSAANLYFRYLNDALWM